MKPTPQEALRGGTVRTGGRAGHHTMIPNPTLDRSVASSQNSEGRLAAVHTAPSEPRRAGFGCHMEAGTLLRKRQPVG